MTAVAHIVGFIRKSDRHTLAAQQAAMERAKVTKVYTDLDLCIQQRRPKVGDVIAIHRAMLLADPKDRRKLGGLRGSFRRNLDRMEAAGAILLELDSNMSTANVRERDKIIRAAEDELGRIRRYSRTGRPNRVWSDHERAVMRRHWFSREHLTNKAAIEAMHADGVRVSMSQVYKALGRSKRDVGFKR